ncbi:AEC family transporter [Balneolaceae bacterium ANBcel3]|nr:AEC family transporter [Balneolaceae bacterium ANBcel3]
MEPAGPIILLLICLIIGMLLQRVRAFPDNTHIALNQYVIYIALPALGLIHIPAVDLRPDLFFPIAVSWLVFFFSILFFKILAQYLQFSRTTTGCLILTGGLGNTAFVGFPVIEALFGAEGMQMAFMVDQPGTFVVVSVFGMVIVGMFGPEKVRKRKMLQHVITFPPFIVFLIALCMNIFGFRATGTGLDILNTFAATLTPIALISVGFQLKWSSLGSDLSPMAWGLSYKLLMAPLLLFLLYVIVLGGQGLIVQVSLIQAAMPPMITGAILASTYGLNPRLASLMVGIGVPLSAITITLWYFFLMWST